MESQSDHANIESRDVSFEVDYDERREAFANLLEWALWAIAAVLLLIRPLTELARGYSLNALYPAFYPSFVNALMVLLFPVVIRLIFGALPIAIFRHRFAGIFGSTASARAMFKTSRGRSSAVGAKARVTPTTRSEVSSEDLALRSTLQLFGYYDAASSRQLSQNIYNRAGVYLLIGVIVAFSGLAFFYSQTGKLGDVGDSVALGRLVEELVPRFGILVFIEIVAFFFLRQYRAAMDEFRYFEAVKRNREETLALIRMCSDAEKKIDPIELVKSQSFFSQAGILQPGQTSELLESRKFEKNELDLLEKVVDALSRSKK